MYNVKFLIDSSCSYQFFVIRKCSSCHLYTRMCYIILHVTYDIQNTYMYTKLYIHNITLSPKH